MGGWAGARLVSRAGWAAGGRGGGAPGRVIGERCGVDATAGGVRSVAVGTVAQDPWYFKAYDGFSRHVATFRDTDASPKEIYTHHEMGSGGSQLAVRRDVDATGGGGWGGSSDGVLETQAFLLHRANGDVIAVVGGLKDTGSVTRPGAVRERMEYVPGGDGAGSVEPMRLSPSDGYQIGGARGADGLVTGDDYNAWIAEYAAGTANGATDLNNNGVVDGDDFTAWNAEWDSGALVGRAIMSVPDGADAKGPGNVRGAMAAAGVALDAVLSGKVSGTKGETGRVNYVPRPASLDVANPGGRRGVAAGHSRVSGKMPELPIGAYCAKLTYSLRACLACCVVDGPTGRFSSWPCAAACFQRDTSGPPWPAPGVPYPDPSDPPTPLLPAPGGGNGGGSGGPGCGAGAGGEPVIGVQFCARPMSTFLWHAYIQIDHFTIGFDGSLYSENLMDGSTRRCAPARKRKHGRLYGTNIPCSAATVWQIQECIMTMVRRKDETGAYDPIANNCANWVDRILMSCCASANFDELGILYPNLNWFPNPMGIDPRWFMPEP